MSKKPDQKNDSPEAGDEPAARKKNGTIILVAAAALLSAGAGSGAYFLTPAGEAHGGKADKHAASPAEKHHGAANETKIEIPDAGTFTAAEDGAYYLPEPLVISLAPDAGARHLKVALAIETTSESETAYLNNALRIRDVLTTYLRAVESGALSDPAYMANIRAQIRRRIELVVAPAPVGDVLILDFILT